MTSKAVHRNVSSNSGRSTASKMTCHKTSSTSSRRGGHSLPSPCQIYKITEANHPPDKTTLYYLVYHCFGYFSLKWLLAVTSKLEIFQPQPWGEVQETWWLAFFSRFESLKVDNGCVVVTGRLHYKWFSSMDSQFHISELTCIAGLIPPLWFQGSPD